MLMIISLLFRILKTFLYISLMLTFELLEISPVLTVLIGSNLLLRIMIIILSPTLLADPSQVLLLIPAHIPKLLMLKHCRTQ